MILSCTNLFSTDLFFHEEVIPKSSPSHPSHCKLVKRVNSGIYFHNLFFHNSNSHGQFCIKKHKK